MTKRNLALIFTIALIISAIAYLEAKKPKVGPTGQNLESKGDSKSNALKKSLYPYAKEISNPSGFINSDGIALANLIGKKVILVDFWTYSCENCQRTIPYLNAWYEKYKDQGLEIIGVHSPEFGFEKELANVRSAVDKFKIRYPVVLDNDYGTWNAYGNRYWPQEYLIDIDGYIVHEHLGEGGYAETEKKIQELLEERMGKLKEPMAFDKKTSQPQGIEAVDFGKIQSPEIYFGSNRNDSLANGENHEDGEQELTPPGKVEINKLYLAGSWNFQKDFAESTRAQNKIIFRYRAKALYFVAGADREIRLKILRDGRPLKNAAGEDILKDGSSEALIKESRLYKLINDPTGYGEHTIEIIIETPGLKAYTFTFG